VSGFLLAEIGRTALTHTQEERLEDRSSILQALNFPSTWPPPSVRDHPHSSGDLPHRQHLTYSGVTDTAMQGIGHLIELGVGHHEHVVLGGALGHSFAQELRSRRKGDSIKW
jgi:hypothetical protein